MNIFEEMNNKLLVRLQERLENEFEEKITITKDWSPKVNIKKEGFSLKKGNESVAPTFYFENLWENFSGQDAIESAADYIIETMNEVIPTEVLYQPISLKQIISCLINREWNEERLKGIPHRDLCDLAVYYRAIISSDEGNTVSSVITNDMAKIYNVTEEELYQAALDSEFNHEVIKSMEDVIKEIMDIPEEFDIPEGPFKMLIISNKMGLYGAGVITNTNILSEIGRKYNSNVYILPSSIHETIAVLVPAGQESEVNVKAMKETVQDVNGTQVQKYERLSDNVYFYDKEKDTLCIM